MNRAHAWLCSSKVWSRAVRDRLLPWALDSVELGERVLEIGPGYGATTRVLLGHVPTLTAVEIDPVLADRLGAVFGEKVRVVRADGAAMPLADQSFTSVVCFIMLHHVSSPAEQDRLIAEAFRVLEPGGMFAGADSVTSAGFRLLHLFDTIVMVDPAGVQRRLEAAGFTDVAIEIRKGHAFRFRARKA